MKNLATKFLITGSAFLALSCNNKGEKQIDNNQDSLQTDISNTKESDSSAQFDISSIPISDKEVGEFPFFSLPTGVAEQNKPILRSFDRLFFPINGVMTPIEGKVWKSYIVSAEDSGESWSLPYFLKSYDDAITSVGGVKIFEGKVIKKELDKAKEQATYFGEEGSIDYWNDPVTVYLIRRAGGDDIYVQISGNSASGELQILQKAAFKQTITLLKSDQIQKDLSDKGKSVLYINFDTDKASLKADGRDAVAEIAKALTADKNLKIAINGYTDNTGDEMRNLNLSKQRANTVKTELEKSAISANRLKSEGYGQANPIADNSSEDGKAKNRRVELVKIN